MQAERQPLGRLGPRRLTDPTSLSRCGTGTWSVPHLRHAVSVRHTGGRQLALSLTAWTGFVTYAVGTARV
ncbi:hypothetical protein GCM10009647_011170 [Streptomyces sanglieri]